jgi:predicted nucleotidyltransferase
MSPAQIVSMQNALRAFGAYVLFVVVVGSRANLLARPDSDWDVAVQWHHDLAFGSVLALGEQLRQALAVAMQITPDSLERYRGLAQPHRSRLHEHRHWPDCGFGAIRLRPVHC